MYINVRNSYEGVLDITLCNKVRSNNFPTASDPPPPLFLILMTTTIVRPEIYADESEVKDQFIKPNISLKGYVFYIIISVAMVIAFKLKDNTSLQMMCDQ